MGQSSAKGGPPPSKERVEVFDHPQGLPSRNVVPFVRDLEYKGSLGSEKLLENPLHRLLALEAREQELEKKKEEFGKTGCLLENKRSDEEGENPHGEID